MTCTCSAGLLSQSLFQLCLPATHPLERGRNRNPAPTPTIIYVYTNNFQEQNYLRALGRNHQKETQTQNKISTKNCLPRDALDYGKIWLAGSGHHLTGFLGTVCETAFFKHFFFHCIIEEWRPFEKTPLRLDSVWVSDCFLGKNCTLGRKFWLEYIYFWKRARLPKKLWREDPENDHRFQKKNTVLEKIDRPLQENRTLLVSKSATAFGKIGRGFLGKATTALGKTGRERFFLRRRVLQNRSGALLK